MYLHDTQTGTTKLLSEHAGDMQFNPQYFSLDGRNYYISPTMGVNICTWQAMTLLVERNKSGRCALGLMYASLSRNGKYRVVAINNDARTEIKIYDESQGGKKVEVAGLPEGDITGVNISDSEN